ncbi:unnamed protein product [Pylaiella littoralis]
MDHFLSAVTQIKASDDPKHDVLYINTPWNKLSVEQMGKIDLSALVKDEALMYLWADTYTMQSAMDLFKIHGFKFDSVYQVCDIASYPAPEAAAPLSGQTPADTPAAETPAADTPAAETPAAETPAAEATAETPAAETPVEKARDVPVVKRAKKQRCPPLSLPSHWKNVAAKGSTRPTTEYLLLGHKGGRDVLDTLMNEKAGTLPYQVVRKPELGKKSRSVPKKNVSLDPDWVCDRPQEFLDTVCAHLKPSVRVLELFGSTLRTATDSIGPNVPGGYCPGYSSPSGIAKDITEAMRPMKKVQLNALCSVLSKMAQTDDRETKVTEFKRAAQTWGEIVRSLAEMKSSVSYDWSSDDPDLPAEWIRLMVLSFAQKTIANFGNLRRKRKKRKTNGDAPRACHGIAKPVTVSKELRRFLGLEADQKVSRTHTVKLLNNYVKANKLQNPAKKIEILPDAPLLKLLNPPAGFGPITYFKMCSLLGPHFPADAKTDGVKEPLAKKLKKAPVDTKQR